MLFSIRVAPIAAFGSSFLLAAATSAAPSVTINPTTNHPSSQVTVSGSGYGANKGIDLFWDTTDKLLVITDSTGKFSNKQIPVPADAPPGAHWVTALERDNGDGAQQPFTVNTDWIEHGFSAKGQRYNPYENVISPANAASLDVAWTYTTGGTVNSSPAVVNGIVYIGSNDGNLWALNAATGAYVWGQNVGVVDFSSPAVVNGIVYIGSTNGRVFAVNASNGHIVWRYPAAGTISGGVQSSPTVVGGVVYIGGNDGNLYALNAATGALDWSFPTTSGSQIRATPAVANGAVDVGSSDSKIYAISTTTHQLIWTVTATAPIYSSPAVSNQKVFYGDMNGEIWAARDDDSWDVGCSGIASATITGSPAAVNGIAYYPSEDGKVYAASPNRHNFGSGCGLKWTYSEGAAIDSSPAVANGVVYFGSNDGEITAVNAATGGFLWTGYSKGAIESSPAVANGMVYVGSQDKKVYAFALNGGSNAVYHRDARPPSYASLHPDRRLKPVR